VRLGIGTSSAAGPMWPRRPPKGLDSVARISSKRCARRRG
jgi:hypothetical protein